MSGLIVTLSETRSAPRLLDVILGAAPGRPRPARRFDEDRCAIALLLPGSVTPRLWRVHGDTCLAFHGQVGRCDEDLLWGGRAEALCELDGLYHAAYWEGNLGRFSLSMDRTGALPLFMARVPGALVFASAPGPLLSWRRGDPLDRAGLAALLRVGFQPGNRTLRLSVRTLPPGSAISVTPGQGGLAISHYQGSSLPAPSGRIGPALKSALLQETAGGTTPRLALTGGVDSNALLCAGGQGASAITVPGGQRGDVSAAARNASALGAAHLVTGQVKALTGTDLDSLRTALGGTSDWHLAALLPLFLEARGAPLLLGFLGGTFGGAFAGPRNGGLGAIASAAHFRYSRPLAAAVPRWCTPRVGAPQDPILAANLYGRQRRYTSGLVRLAWQYCRPVCPFASSEVIAAALGHATPGARRRALVRELDGFGALINGNDGLPMHSALRRGLHCHLRGTALARVVRHLLPRFPGGYQADSLAPVAEVLAGHLTPARRDLLDQYGRSAFARFALIPVLLDEPDETVTAMKEMLE